MTEKKYTPEERYQIKKDLMDKKIPERVFVNLSLGIGVLADYAGLDRKEVLWHPELITDTVKEMCTKFTSDVQPWGGNVIQPSVYQAMGAINIQMGDSGFMQHPNTHALEAEDWDAFIEDPLACILERGFPRIYKSLDYKADPVRSQFTLAQMFMATADNGTAFLSFHTIVGGIGIRIYVCGGDNLVRNLLSRRTAGIFRIVAGSQGHRLSTYA